MAKNILNIEDLCVSFDTYAGEVQAVRGVTYHVDEGEVLAVVGESGCGKSVTAQTIMKLNPMPPARIKSGKLTLDGVDIIAATESEMQKIRGKDVSMIFQDPMTCLNPTMHVGKQIVEANTSHQEKEQPIQNTFYTTISQDGNVDVHYYDEEENQPVTLKSHSYQVVAKQSDEEEVVESYDSYEEAKNTIDDMKGFRR